MEVLYDGALPLDVLPLITGTTVVMLGVVASGLAALANARASDVAPTRSESGRLRIVAFPSDARPMIDPPPESTLISNRVAVFTAKRFIPYLEISCVMVWPVSLVTRTVALSSPLVSARM